jgi:hypothetical protein
MPHYQIFCHTFKKATINCEQTANLAKRRRPDISLRAVIESEYTVDRGMCL